MSRFAVLALVAVGCSTGPFDDREDQAPAQVSGDPEGVDSEDYATAIVPVTSDRLGVHVAVLGTGPHTLSTVSYDDRGELLLAGDTLVELGAGATTASTLIASPEPIAGGDGVIALGGDGAILLFDARTGELGPEFRRRLDAGDCGGDPLTDLADLGFSMVFALTDLGAAEQPDLVALADGELVAFVDVTPDQPPTCLRCPLDVAGATALAAGDIGGAEGVEILLARGGELLAFSGTVIESHHEQSAACFQVETPQISGLLLDGSTEVGSRIAVGQGDEVIGLEVAVTEPSEGNVYLIENLTSSGPGGPTVTIAGDADAVDFGAAVAFGDLDGDDHDELIIGDPGAPAGGESSAGQVSVYAFGDDGAELAARLHDPIPVSDQVFGRTLAVSEFVGTEDDQDLLIVGADNEIFTYFRALTGSVDPRR